VLASARRIDQPEGKFLDIPPEPFWIGIGWPRDPSISALLNCPNRRKRYYGTWSRVLGLKNEDLGLDSEETQTGIRAGQLAHENLHPVGVCFHWL
jgi:hypothetical protein